MGETDGEAGREGAPLLAARAMSEPAVRSSGGDQCELAVRLHVYARPKQRQNPENHIQVGNGAASLGRSNVMHWSIAYTAALVLASVGCAGSAIQTGTSERQAGPPTPTDAESASWLTNAEIESRAHLTNQCPVVAPLAVIRPGNSIWQTCIARADAAVDDEWNRVRDLALKACVDGSADECCFEKYAPGADYERRRAECSARCAQLRTGTARSVASCKSRDVAPAEADSSRFLTPATRAVVARCETHADALAECAGLPTHIERTVCEGNCRQLEGYRVAYGAFVNAIKACAMGVAIKLDACVLDWSTEKEGFEQANCKAACVEYRKRVKR